MSRKVIGGRAVFAGAALLLLVPATAGAQDYGSRGDYATQTVDGTVISAGGGVAYIALPDVRFTFFTDPATGDTTGKQKNNDLENYGGGFSGGVETPLNWFGSASAVFSGFYANIEDDDRTRCRTGGECGFSNIIDTTGPSSASPVGDLLTLADRDVDHWGISGGLKWSTPMTLPGFGLLSFQRLSWGAGADVRGIDQELFIRGVDSASSIGFDYDEELDTTYAGGYLSLGGEYKLNLFGTGLWDRLGLRSFFTAHVGVYHVDTDYDGFYAPVGLGQASSRLSLSDEDAAVIAGLKLETRKQLSPRTSLSLYSEYEYYSWAPEMRYNDADNGFDGIVDGTRIDDDDAFASRTSLRLNIGLGPDPLYSSMK